MNLVQTLALVGLAAVWAWVLGRPLLQNMFNAARRDPVGHFKRQQSVLGNAPVRSLAHSTGVNQSWGRQPASKRRLQLMLALVIATVVAAVLAVVLRGIFVWQLSLLFVLLLAYVLLAARAGARELERGSKVTYLHSTSERRPVQIQAVGER
jgi:hypothetical protein